MTEVFNYNEISRERQAAVQSDNIELERVPSRSEYEAALDSFKNPTYDESSSRQRFAAVFTRAIRKEMTVGDALHQIGKAARSRK